ncbi:hypothetical protein VE01_04090 [Pseudogymnoascus verrucosus]|uniref:CSC1/OSCA1-like 7TM region domain-containing protein n=1 Tax=Pseudogymnoascus verrucosus TaxID=342668 RepID=A0A1B8GLM8_9PEZI|nr:uncharacterized protein VE01_04090 [Pseudogymnoascus verrucosus]OBT96739.1 hypothetical protein VE01_04090 [Pseudogymnoascus verrucosus]
MAALIVDALALHINLKRDPENSDPRVGSARNGSTSGGTLSNATKGTNTSSIPGLLATLVPVIVYAVVCLLIFWGCRTRYPRVYSPRSILSSLEPHERPKKLPSGWFNWLKPLFKTPDLDVLHKSSIDGFLFLRFLRILCTICIVGACITWPVLFPLHILGGGGGSQLDALTFGNVKKPSWYFVHAFLAWIFFGFILYMISRECVYYINLRQAYLLSPYYAKRLSSRTVLFTCVPEQFRDEARLKKLFGDSVKNVWIPTYSGDLDDLVKERNQTALRLEDAEIELIRLANVERNKVMRNGKSDIEANTPASEMESKGEESPEKDVSTLPTNVAGGATSGFELADRGAVASPEVIGEGVGATELTVGSSALESVDATSEAGGASSPLGFTSGASPKLTRGASIASASNLPGGVTSPSGLTDATLASPSSLTDATLASPSGLTDATLASPSGFTDATIVSPASDFTGATLVSPSSASTDEATMVKSNTKDSKNETSSITITQSQTPNLDTPNAEWPELKWGIQRGIPNVRGSVAAQWIPVHWRPHHRPLANYGRRVDTIKWTRNRLKALAPRIYKLRRKHRNGDARRMPAAFIEFDTLVNAQSAYQTLPHHRPFHMTPHINGIRPEEIVWSTLRMKWWERIVRNFMATAVVAVMVVFWSLPAAGVALISKIDFLTDKVIFLRWINKLPKPILGLITGLLPAVALSLLMATVPMILRAVARQSGVPSLSMIELFVLKSYFIFQVVQVFLVTTLTAAISASLTKIIENPLSVQNLLSESLPKASNFYVSYLILQGLAMSATRVVHLPSLHRAVFANGKTPRMMSTRWHRLKTIHWGSDFPLFANMGVIVISYSCIAPIILAFGAMCFYFVHKVYHYNLLYVYSSEVDTRGLLYPHALMQILTGVYLAEICLIGLFGIQAAFGPLLMMLMLAIFTFLVQISLNDALGPLLYNLPRSLSVQGLYDDLEEEEAPIVVEDLETQYDSDFDPGEPNAVTHEELGTRGVAVEGTKGYSKVAFRFLSASMQEKFSARAGSVSSFFQSIDFWSAWISPDGTNPKPNFLLKWLHPEVFHDFNALRGRIPTDLPDPDYTPELLREAYLQPSLNKINDPMLWIPADPAGVSRQEVEHSKGIIKITDQMSWLEEKKKSWFQMKNRGVNVKIRVDFDAESPVVRKRMRY